MHVRPLIGVATLIALAAAPLLAPAQADARRWLVLSSSPGGAGDPDPLAVPVNNLLLRARAAFESRLPAAGRERAPLPNSKVERDVVGSFADAVEAGDIDRLVALLTDDAWLTMPPEPWEYQGPAAIGVFLRDREVSRGRLRLVPTRANGQPAFGCYLPTAQTDIARPYSLFVLTLQGDEISAITWFADSSVFSHFGLPRMPR